ncbi:Rsp5p-dependent ubiquitination, sorting of cargo proteins at the multivesicular body [Quaeritorhiza haematococci]|nr:Rsp5p-dependent ubiquitination, sorting of cargo proteins at the multivesicular body [Quaeritorhiza haematococci]
MRELMGAGPVPGSMFESYNNAAGGMVEKAVAFQTKNAPPRESEIPAKKLKEIEALIEKHGHAAWAFAKPPGSSSKSKILFTTPFNITFPPHTAKSNKPNKSDTDLAVLSSIPLYRDPAHPNREYFYYECTIVDLAYAPKTTVIGIGVATSPYPSFRLVGWHDYSVGYHSDDGRVFVNDAFGGRIFASPFTKGDTVGVGYDPTRGAVFFTLNGSFLSDATSNEFHPYHAAVSADGPCELEINFGQKPFVYQPANPGWTPDTAAPLTPPLSSPVPSTLESPSGASMWSVPLLGSAVPASSPGDAVWTHDYVQPYPPPNGQMGQAPGGVLMQNQQMQQQQEHQQGQALPAYMNMPTPM